VKLRQDFSRLRYGDAKTTWLYLNAHLHIAVLKKSDFLPPILAA
jgi:hypothetical protein